MADTYRRNIYDVMRERERESRASAQANPLDVYREVLDAGGGKSDPLAVYRQVLEEKRQEEERKKKGNALSRTVVKEEQTKEKTPNIIDRVTGTIQDARTNLSLGLFRSIEGTVDFVAGLGGAAAGLVSRDAQDAVKGFIEKDWTGIAFKKYTDIYEGFLRREYAYGSVQSPDGIAAEVEQAIGGMLPAVAVSLATSGAASGTMVSSLKGATGAAKAASAASKAAKVSKVASMATMATGAAGQSTQEAYRDGASYGRGLAYGTLRGATEAGTEMLVGGVAGRVMGTGTGVFDDVLRSVARNKASRIALEAAGEGLEEVLSEAADPLTRSVYKGSEALDEYASPEFAGRLGKSFGVGALTSTVFGQTVGRATGQVGAEADVRELISDVETLDKKRYNLDLREKLTTEADAKIEAQELEDYHEIEGILKKAAPEKRAGIIERLGLESKFSEDGTLREDFAASLGRKFSRGVAAAEGENGAQGDSTGSAVPFERRMASVDADTEAVSRALSKTGRVQYAGELSGTGKQNLKKLKSVMHRFSDLSRGALGQFVIADESVENDAYYDPETGYIVLGKDVLEREDGVKKSVSRAWFAAALHEVTHGVDKTVSGVFMEAALGTLEDGKHYSRVFKELSNRGYLEGKASDIRRRIERYMEKQAKGQALTEKESAELNVFHSECAPLIAERVLNNEHFLRELIAEDASLVERLLGKLADLRESTSRVRDPEARAVIKEIRAIEETLLDAVAERGMAYRDRKLVMVNREREEEEVKERRKETDGAFDYTEYDKPITIEDVEVLRSIGRKSINEFTAEDIKKAQKWAYKFYKDMGVKSPFFRAWFGDWRAESSSEAEIVKFAYGESPTINYKERTVINHDMNNREITIDYDAIGDSLHYAKVNGDEKQIRKLLGKIDEILSKAIWLDTRISIKTSGNKKGSTQFMHYLYTPISINGAPFIAKLTVEEYDLTSKQRAYNLQRIEMPELSRAQYAQLISENKEKYAYSSDSLSVAQLFDFVKRFDEGFKPKAVHRCMLNDDNTPKMLYHQTGEDFVKFDPRRKGAGTNDDETPFGIFLKPTSEDIGLQGKKQMAVYARITNPLIAADRAALVRQLKGMSGKYAELLRQREALTVEYEKKIEDAGHAWSKYAKDYHTEHPDAPRDALYDDAEFQKLYDFEDELTEEWEEKANGLALQMKEEITRTLKTNGHDGVVLERDAGSGGRSAKTYIALESTQVKSATDNIGTFDGWNTDIRFSRKPKAKKPAKPANEHAFDDAVRRMEERDASSDEKAAEGDGVARANEEKVQVSEGEAQKKAAVKETSQKKVADNSALLEREIERRLTRELRDTKTKEAKTAITLRLADVITREGAVLDVASEASLTEAREVIESMKEYVQKTDVSAVQEEIKATIGKDSRGLFSRWSKKDGVPIAKIRKKIGSEHGQVVRDMSDAQFLMWMDEEYIEARAVVDGAVDKVLGADKRSTDAEVSSLLRTVADEILARFDKSGELSEVARIREFYEAQKAKYVSEAEQSRRYSKAYGETMTLLERVREWKIGRFQSSTRPEHRDIFAQTIGQIAKLNVNGRLTNPDRLRRLVGALGEWYTAENMERMGFIARKDDGTYDGATGFNREIGDYIKEIADGDGAVTAAELENLNRVIRFMKHMAENYQKVRKNGKRVDALPVAQEMVAIQKDAAKLKVGAMDYFFSSWYMRSYADPRMLCRYMDKYHEGGFYTEMLNRLTDGLITAKAARMNIEKKIDAAMGGKVDKYLRDLHKRTYRYGGRDIPAAQALSLYLTSRRKQAWAALIENGFYFHEETKPGQRGSRMEANGLIGAGIKYTQAEAEAKIAELQAELKGQMTEQDDAFVKVIDQIMNNDCRDLKRATDEERMGYSNALEDFYYPIKRGDTAQNVDRNSFFDEMSRVTNASFNKNTEKGARGRLAIESVDDVVNRHVRGVTMYAGLATVIDDYNMLYHLNVDVDAEGKGNHGAPTTVASCAENTWMQGKQYFEKLIADVQEVRTTDGDEVTSFIGKLRGKYARAVLSLNLKVCATQLSSLISATALLDYECVVKGFSDNGRDVFKYSELAELRAYENTVAMAQGVIDEAGDKLMKPIGATDQFVVRRIFVACQHQVAKDQKLKIGTEENKRAAAALLDRVILETQQNALATEKSQAARSTSEFQKMVTMFRADAVKNIGRLLEAMGEISVIKREAKIFGTRIDEARLNAAKHRRNKAAMSLVMVAAFTTALAKVFRWALKREEEDEWTWQNTLAELVGNFLGGLPLISDAYERLFGSGYGMEDMSVSALNGVLDSVSGLIDVAGQVASGDLDERLLARDLRQMVFSLGQVTGMPTQNVYKYARAIVHRVSPETGYKMDDAFYKSSYRADMADAIASEDEAQLETIIGVMLNENVGRVTSESVRVELGRLMLAGEDALPRSVPEVITVGDDSVKLTARQRKRFESIYGEANAAVEKMIGRRQYGDVDDAVRAKAIKQVYGIYYNRAVEELLGVELEAKNVLFAEAFDPGDLALIVAACGEIRADVGADGKAISGSRKEKVIKYVESLKLRAAQKYMIMGYLGYRNTTGRQVVFRYIESLRISKAKKEALFEMSGYEG